MLKNTFHSKKRISLFRAFFLILVFAGAWVLVSFSVIFLECPEILQLSSDRVANKGNGGDGNGTSQTRHLYIPGSGFSGFFFTLGRLQFLHNSNPKRENAYYCFSAGCLALVATLMEVPLHDTVEIATKSRLRWRKGDIGRYDIVRDFINDLLDRGFYADIAGDSFFFETEDAPIISTNDLPHDLINASNVLKWDQSHKIDHHLQNIYVITSTWSKQHPMITQSIRTPLTVQDLQQMLIQTTWIQFITGPKIGKEDAFGVNHNDGAFAAILNGWHSLLGTTWITETIHQYALKLPWDAELIWNGLNIALDQEQAEYFWKKGFMHDELYS